MGGHHHTLSWALVLRPLPFPFLSGHRLQLVYFLFLDSGAQKRCRQVPVKILFSSRVRGTYIKELICEPCNIWYPTSFSWWMSCYCTSERLLKAWLPFISHRNSSRWVGAWLSAQFSLLLWVRNGMNMGPCCYLSEGSGNRCYKKIYLFLMCLSVLPARMHVHHVHAWCLYALEEGTGFLNGVTDSCESACELWKWIWVSARAAVSPAPVHVF